VDRAELTRRLADLAVGLGANVQPGQIVTVSGNPEGSMASGWPFAEAHTGRRHRRTAWIRASLVAHRGLSW